MPSPRTQLARFPNRSATWLPLCMEFSFFNHHSCVALDGLVQSVYFDPAHVCPLRVEVEVEYDGPVVRPQGQWSSNLRLHLSSSSPTSRHTPSPPPDPIQYTVLFSLDVEPGKGGVDEVPKLHLRRGLRDGAKPG